MRRIGVLVAMVAATILLLVTAANAGPPKTDGCLRLPKAGTPAGVVVLGYWAQDTTRHNQLVFYSADSLTSGMLKSQGGFLVLRYYCPAR